MSEITILENQLVIMKAMVKQFQSDNMYFQVEINELKERIMFTEARIRGMK